MQWTNTPLEDIRIDVHLKDGVTSIPLSMLIALIYPVISAQMDEELRIQISNPTKIDGEKIIAAVWGLRP